MACAVDASSPVRWNSVSASNTNTDSASFTAPANSFLVLCAEFDGDFGVALGLGTQTVTVSLATGSALTWTQQVARTWSEGTDGGSAYIITAPAVTSEARVVRVNSTWTANTGSAARRSMRLYVVTGADIDGTPVDTVTANNEGTSTTNNLTTTAITPSSNGLGFGAACDWTAGGGASYEAPSDGSTQDTAWYSGQVSVVDGWRVATSGVAWTINFNAGGAAAAQHKWGQIIVREAAAAAARRFLLVRR